MIKIEVRVFLAAAALGKIRNSKKAGCDGSDFEIGLNIKVLEPIKGSCGFLMSFKIDTVKILIRKIFLFFGSG